MTLNSEKVYHSGEFLIFYIFFKLKIYRILENVREIKHILSNKADLPRKEPSILGFFSFSWDVIID